METQEPRNKTQVNKNFIIIALSIALIIVSAIAIGQAHRGRGYGRSFEDGKHFRGNMMMRDGNYRSNAQNQLPPAPVGTSTTQ